MIGVEERFWDKVQIGSGCWQWTAGCTEDGYPVFSIHGKSVRGHRFSYELTNGPIEDGLQVDHLCRNRGCVNPLHMEIVSPRENVLRSMSPAALNAAKEFCSRGHEFNEKNTYRYKNKRTCRTCRQLTTNRYLSDPIKHEKRKARMRARYYERKLEASQ